jgi:hypothetical protein
MTAKGGKESTGPKKKSKQTKTNQTKIPNNIKPNSESLLI